MKRRSDERGVVMVWLAITLVLLLGITAFAVDVAYWQVTKNREQRAADASALAGAVTFPGDLATANAQAQGVAGANGYTVGSVNALDGSGGCPLPSSATTAVCTGAGDRAYQYKVTVAQKVNNFFGKIFGIGSTTVRATAQAEYLAPLKMGSPSNQYGNDPDASTTTQKTYPNFWANINGAGTAVQQGDAYAADWCQDINGENATDGCTALGDGNNSNYTPNGYYYAVDFNSAGATDLQVFDPALVNVGQFCQTAQAPGANLAGAAALHASQILGYPGSDPDVLSRFRPVGPSVSPGPGQPAVPPPPTDPGWKYCTGDNTFPNSAGATDPPTTTYTVLKATVPGHPESATPVPGCSQSFSGFNGDIADALQHTPGFAQEFRQWVTLCHVSGDKGDEYFIQVQTDGGAGSNHFALRGTSSAVTIAGNTYMGMYANVGTNTPTNFYLVRIPPAAQGHTLLLNLYDIGDADSKGTLQVLPPTDATGSNISGSHQFVSGCNWTGTATGGALGAAKASPGQPWGTLTPISNCTIPNVNRVGLWQAQWSTVSVDIPTDYDCTDTDPNGCWFTITYSFDGPVHDVTSWTAALLGDPVRLVK